MFEPIGQLSLQFDFGDGLAVAATADPAAPLLKEFFAAYDRAFVLPSEKEELQGFVSCLALNSGADYAALSAQWGVYREWLLLLRDSDAAVVGGANFICFPLRSGAAHVLSMNLNYLFVEPASRGRGYFRILIDACRELARRSFEPAPAQDIPVLIYVEQNDPLKLTAEEYARDSSYAGIDQIDRLRIWRRAGALIVDFPYVQPALSAEQEADRGLALSVIGGGNEAIDASLFLQQMERFFGISVLKGRDPRSDAVAREQLELIEAACAARQPIPLLDPLPWLNRFGSAPPYNLPQGAGLDLPSRLKEVFRQA